MRLLRTTLLLGLCLVLAGAARAWAETKVELKSVVERAEVLLLRHEQ